MLQVCFLHTQYNIIVFPSQKYDGCGRKQDLALIKWIQQL